MVSDKLGRNRSKAFYQLVALVLFATVLLPVLAILFTIGILAGLLFMLLDVLMGLVRDRRFTGGGALRRWGIALFTWPFDIVFWVFTGSTTGGQGGFPWLPSSNPVGM